MSDRKKHAKLKLRFSRIAMRYYENLDPVERRRLVLGAVAFSLAMEGMSEARDACLKELRELEREQAEAALKAPSGQAGR
jgi:hypothetical protein